MSLLFHETLIEVAMWYASGRASEVLRSCVSASGGMSGRLDPMSLHCNLGLECSDMTSLAGGLRSFVIKQGSERIPGKVDVPRPFMTQT